MLYKHSYETYKLINIHHRSEVAAVLTAPRSSHPWSESNWYALMFFSSACMCVRLFCSETGRARASCSQGCHPRGRGVLGNQSLTCVWETCLVSSLALFPIPLSLSRSLNRPPPFPSEFLWRSLSFLPLSSSPCRVILYTQFPALCAARRSLLLERA